MNPDVLAHGFREAAGLLDIEESRLRYWAQTGLLTPSGQRGQRRYYTFADLIALRAAHELGRLGVAASRVRDALQELSGTIPGDLAAQARLRIDWDGVRLFATEEGADASEGEPLFRACEIRARIDETVVQTGSAPSAYHYFVDGCRLDERPGTEAEAEAAYRRAIEADPALGSAWTNLGNLLHRRGDSAGARSCYERAVDLDPDHPEARYNLANVLDESGDAEMAIAEYERTLRVAPDFADAHYNLALLLERIGATDRAQAHLRRYRELSPEKIV